VRFKASEKDDLNPIFKLFSSSISGTCVGDILGFCLHLQPKYIPFILILIKLTKLKVSKEKMVYYLNVNSSSFLSLIFTSLLPTPTASLCETKPSLSLWICKLSGRFSVVLSTVLQFAAK